MHSITHTNYFNKNSSSIHGNKERAKEMEREIIEKMKPVQKMTQAIHTYIYVYVHTEPN